MAWAQWPGSNAVKIRVICLRSVALVSRIVIENYAPQGDVMPATGNTPTGASSPPSATGSRDGGHRHLGHGRRLRSGAAPHGPPDVGALAREAVISFLHDASKATAEREAVRAGVAAADAEAAVTAAAGHAFGDGE